MSRRLVPWIRSFSATMTQDNFYADCLAPSGVYKYFFENQWVESSSGKTVKILNPSTNTAIYEVQGEKQ